MKNFMDAAYKEAEKAYLMGEVPVGAVVVKDETIVARGHNTREKSQIATKHAEIVAIEKACRKLKSWRLEGCVLYVTTEPCMMCLGAVLNARIDKVIYGADDYNGGARKFVQLSDTVALNWNTELIKAEGEERCSKILTRFFTLRRGANRADKL